MIYPLGKFHSHVSFRFQFHRFFSHIAILFLLFLFIIFLETLTLFLKFLNFLIFKSNEVSDISKLLPFFLVFRFFRFDNEVIKCKNNNKVRNFWLPSLYYVVARFSVNLCFVNYAIE